MDIYEILRIVILLLSVTVFVINLVYFTLLAKAIDVDWLYGMLQLYGSFIVFLVTFIDWSPHNY